MKAIIPGITLKNVIGVSELWASLNDFERLATAIHKPLIRNEKLMMIRMVTMMVGSDGIRLIPSKISKAPSI